MIEPQHRSSPMPRLCTMYAISLHDRRACVPWQGAFALELTAALAVDPQAIERTVSLAVILEDPAHVVQHLHDRIAKSR